MTDAILGDLRRAAGAGDEEASDQLGRIHARTDNIEEAVEAFWQGKNPEENIEELAIVTGSKHAFARLAFIDHDNRYLRKFLNTFENPLIDAFNFCWTERNPSVEESFDEFQPDKADIELTFVDRNLDDLMYSDLIINRVIELSAMLLPISEPDQPLIFYINNSRNVDDVLKINNVRYNGNPENIFFKIKGSNVQAYSNKGITIECDIVLSIGANYANGREYIQQENCRFYAKSIHWLNHEFPGKDSIFRAETIVGNADRIGYASINCNYHFDKIPTNDQKVSAKVAGVTITSTKKDVDPNFARHSLQDSKNSKIFEKDRLMMQTCEKGEKYVKGKRFYD